MARRDGRIVTPDFQTVVVGAGVIGLAIARVLARAGHEVLILEAEERIGQHTSSRNSGVIHAGIYYPPGSLRARLCVRGRDMLYDYCATRHVAHEKTGKLVVATDLAQLAQLKTLATNAQKCGVAGLRMLSAQEARTMEPELACVGALFSPDTGIVDAPALMNSLLGEAEAAGAMLALGSKLGQVTPLSEGYQLQVGDTQLTTINLINAAGLGSWDVARAMAGCAQEQIPAQHMAKGHWFSLAGPSVFQRLIYPLADGASLGVHYTRDLGGANRFGPDLHYLAQQVVDYSGDHPSSQEFESSVRRWWPGLPVGKLQPDGCGIRPRITPQGQGVTDYRFVTAREHGYKGVIHLFGMESPGLTSCLAIAELVKHMLEGAQK